MTRPELAALLRRGPYPEPLLSEGIFCLRELRGRLSEITSAGAGAAVTLAFRVLLDAQGAGEPVAWITTRRVCFFPPDAAESGADLEALAVVRVPSPPDILRAADMLARSGAFGLYVLDVGPADVPMAAQSRLLGLAQKHDAAVLFLTKKGGPSLGSLVSLRGEARRARTGPGAFSCELTVVKDKRRAPGWTHTEVCRGSTGLR
jgi:recombination protein RecA